jgi:anti-anti-sigma regulatory factor
VSQDPSPLAIPGPRRAEGATELAARWGTETITVPDELAGAAVEALAEQLQQAMREGRRRVVLDLSSVVHWSFAAQVMILSVARALRRRGGELRLYNPGDEVVREGRQLDMLARVRTIAGRD